ncbi:MAG: hypothetical protein V5A43_01240 [Haloarculaceae archaeon]
MPTNEAGDDSASDGTGDRSGRTDPASRADLDALQGDVTALEETLGDLRDELEGGRTGSPFPTPSLANLRRFTSEVSIPMTILVLETNLRALRILQRALRAAPESGAATDRGGRGGAVSRRAADASLRALGRLDGALADLQSSAVAGGAEGDGTVAELLAEADRLRDRVRTELDRVEASTARADEAWDTSMDAVGGPTDGGEAVAVDVDAELDSIRAQVNEETENDGRGDEQRAGEGDGE